MSNQKIKRPLIGEVLVDNVLLRTSVKVPKGGYPSEKTFLVGLSEQIFLEKTAFFFKKGENCAQNQKMNEKLKEQLKDLSLNNQPLMTSFVTIGPKLERVPVGPGTRLTPPGSVGKTNP